MAGGGGVTAGLIVSDFVISFMWVWSSTLIKMFVKGVLKMGHEPSGEAVIYTLYVINMFLFAFLGKISKGGSYNPLNVFAPAISGDFSYFLLTVGARIPAQVIGSITGVRYIIQTIPEVGFGPRLNVDIVRGVITEGLLAFTIVTVSLGLARKIPGSFFTKTWIASLSKLTLQILSSDMTGGYLNPATVMGWAYARGDHITKEHLLVYWLAPIAASFLAVWTFKLVIGPVSEKKKEKGKSD